MLHLSNALIIGLSLLLGMALCLYTLKKRRKEIAVGKMNGMSILLFWRIRLWEQWRNLRDVLAMQMIIICLGASFYPAILWIDIGVMCVRIIEMLLLTFLECRISRHIDIENTLRF